MSSFNLMLYVGLCLFPFTIADCIQPPLSVISQCSGNGECVSESCRCYEGYSGLSVFYNATEHDCNTHVLTFYIISYISFGSSCLSLFAILYRLATFAPHRRISWTIARDPLVILFCITGSTSLGLTWQGLYIFGDYYVHNSILSCIAFIAMWIVLQVSLLFIVRLYINLMWTTVLQKSLQTSHLIIIATPLGVNVLGSGCILGIYLSPNHDYQMAFAQSFGGVFGPCLLFLALSLVVILSLVLNNINRHVKVSEMTKNTKNYEIIQRGIAKLQQTRLIVLVSLVVPATATVAWVMVPMLITYLLPAFFALTSLSNILFVVRVVTPASHDVEGKSIAAGISHSKSGVLSARDR